MEFVAVLLVLQVVVMGGGFCDSTTSVRVLGSMPLQPLAKLLTFMEIRPSQMNVDSTFGVVIAEGQLLSALSHLQHKGVDIQNGALTKVLHFLVRKCRKVRSAATPTLKYNSKSTKLISEFLLDPSIWMTGTIVESGQLSDGPPLQWTVSDLKRAMFYGHPNEQESDACISSLLSGYDPGTRQRYGPCVVTPDCWKAFTTGTAGGYPLTHRLLFLQVVNRVHCGNSLPHPATSMNSSICELVLMEAKAFIQLSAPNLARDLFIEQIVLCGLEGFAEFVRSDWLELVMTWQSPQGCFGTMSHSQQHNLKIPPSDGNKISHARNRRESNPMSFKCENHMSGLAAALYGIFIRVAVDRLVVTSTMKA